MSPFQSDLLCLITKIPDKINRLSCLKEISPSAGARVFNSVLKSFMHEKYLPTPSYRKALSFTRGKFDYKSSF